MTIVNIVVCSVLEILYGLKSLQMLAQWTRLWSGLAGDIWCHLSAIEAHSYINVFTSLLPSTAFYIRNILMLSYKFEIPLTSS